MTRRQQNHLLHQVARKARMGRVCRTRRPGLPWNGCYLRRSETRHSRALLVDAAPFLIASSHGYGDSRHHLRCRILRPCRWYWEKQKQKQKQQASRPHGQGDVYGCWGDEAESCLLLFLLAPAPLRLPLHLACLLLLPPPPPPRRWRSQLHQGLCR